MSSCCGMNTSSIPFAALGPIRLDMTSLEKFVFDMCGDAQHPHMIWLLEFWASESALIDEHARQACYQHVRGMEAQALTGAFEERLLVEQGHAPQQLPDNKSLGTQSAYLTIWSTATADLTTAFDRSAAAIRAAPSIRFWQLYANTQRRDELVFFEAWDNACRPQRCGRFGNPACIGRADSRDD